MSYATSLLMAYPPPYGPSTLLSDDLVQRSSYPAYYEPQDYKSNSRLLSDNFIYSSNVVGPMSYRSMTNSNFPSITDWQHDIPTYPSMSNVREYSDSLATASNTTTASSLVQPVEENVFPNYQTGYNRYPTERERSSHMSKVWSPPRPSKLSAHEDQPITTTFRSLPDLPSTKKSPFEGMTKDATPVPNSRKEDTHFPREGTLLDIERQPTVDAQDWLQETKRDSPVDQNAAEETAWIGKIDQLHTTQTQREKEKVKATRALPAPPKKTEHKPSPTHDNKSRVPSYENRSETYFDSIFDGNFYRKQSTNQQRFGPSYQQKMNSNSPNKPKTIILPRYGKPIKIAQYEPPSFNRPRPPITTSSWRKQGENQKPTDSQTPRENIHKDSGERYKEALQKFRTDRAEQQQRDQTDTTAKRLNYGNYVRRSTREGSLLTLIKPSPWSDFIDLKKGNLYSINKEEKKELYNQSRTYGERIRNRNNALHRGDETNRSQRYSLPAPMENEETQSGDETTREDDHDFKTLKRSNSTSTLKTYTKQFDRPRKSSSSNNSSEDEVTSDVESHRKMKKRIYQSSNRNTTTGTEETDHDDTTDHRNSPTKNSDDDLFTVREEKTLESLENLRGKKR